MPFIETLAQQLGGQGAGNILGLAMQPLANNMQVRQNKRLQQQQIQGQKEMTDYQMSKQLQMWKDTNYPAQVEQLKAAGLNPAMLYGMGGGGGATTGDASGQVQGQHAMIPQMGIQAGNMALIEAQRKNIEADTANKLAENPNIPKQGAVLDATAANITQTTNNLKADEALKKIAAGIDQVKLNIANATEKDQIGLIKTSLNQAMQELEIVTNEAEISTKTKADKIASVGQAYTNLVLDAAIKKSVVKVQAQEIEKMKAEIAQGWEKVAIEWERTGIMDFESQTHRKQYDVNESVSIWERGEMQSKIALNETLDKYFKGETGTLPVEVRETLRGQIGDIIKTIFTKKPIPVKGFGKY